MSATVRVGSNHRNEGGEIIDVVEKHMHPKYSDKNYDYDFLILQLEKTNNFPEIANFIKLPDKKNQKLVDGDMTLVSGWGFTKNELESNEVLRAVEVPVVNIKKCKKAYAREANKITAQMFCAGFDEGGRDSCAGDSGGPVKRKSDGVLIGVVSWGIDCALTDFPGVYSKVSSVRSWIRKITKI
jgi:trypsin